MMKSRPFIGKINGVFEEVHLRDDEDWLIFSKNFDSLYPMSSSDYGVLRSFMKIGGEKALLLRAIFEQAEKTRGLESTFDSDFTEYDKEKIVSYIKAKYTPFELIGWNTKGLKHLAIIMCSHPKIH